MHDLGLSPKGADAPAATAPAAPAPADTPVAAVTGTVIADYGVAGMTCGHCVSAVTEELSALDGVRSVGVELVPGGVSRVRVGSDAALEASAVSAAIDEAGYEPAELAR